MDKKTKKKHEDFYKLTVDDFCRKYNMKRGEFEKWRKKQNLFKIKRKKVRVFRTMIESASKVSIHIDDKLLRKIKKYAEAKGLRPEEVISSCLERSLEEEIK